MTVRARGRCSPNARRHHSRCAGSIHARMQGGRLPVCNVWRAASRRRLKTLSRSSQSGDTDGQWRTLVPTNDRTRGGETSGSRKVADEWLEFYVLVSGSGSDTAERERQMRSDLRGGIYELRRNRRCQIRRIMGEGSSVSVLTLEKPLGLVLAPDTKGNIRVIDIEEGGRAAKLNAVSKLQGDSAVQRGDVLRAITTSTVQIDMARGSLTGTYIYPPATCAL